jgi:hypothetical protein
MQTMVPVNLTGSFSFRILNFHVASRNRIIIDYVTFTLADF